MSEDWDAILIIGDSKKNADLFWVTDFKASDFIFIQTKKDKIIVADALEIERARIESRATKFLLVQVYWKKAKKKIGKVKFKNLPLYLKVVETLDLIFRELGIRKILIQREFNFATGKALEKKGYELFFKERDPFFEQRAVKTEEEIGYITEVQRFMEIAFKRALKVIQDSEIKKGLLLSNGRALTSEDVKRIIEWELFKKGCLAKDTICSCGEATAMPHNKGTGRLKAYEPIIIDIFPQSKTGYFADMTRTVVKGKASKKLTKMYYTVLEGQKIALGMIREGAESDIIHEAVEKYFTSQGFKTSKSEDPPYGFIHSTGHSLGLEIHECPTISPYAKYVLKAGNVVAVEPGLYYPDIGGVRIEDLVVVTKDGYRNLTQFPKEEFEL